MNFSLSADPTRMHEETDHLESDQTYLRESTPAAYTTTTPSPKDVLCGRGAPINLHPGNVIFRKVVHVNKPLYNSCEKYEKFRIAQSIVEAFEKQNPPIRFLVLQNLGNGEAWGILPKSKAVRKTVQALREKEKVTKNRNPGDKITPNNVSEQSSERDSKDNFAEQSSEYDSKATNPAILSLKSED
mmetsp:Transcript_7652/g.11700  ORF Transcript_7652/g.11700 Transcript_7652/m.11700 type:complete len:186 (-) Transcript_7652:361-918(-)|eukprot:CAMPEP_0178903998 /NCGR_PEP_ID=MMETSP0786-20121207/5462_1 /TAXON_ID=186022 /ORGANISM="Thalassionema frauenfeldii, Strain CCMP 1798" /LENGTH=185 /DNA_ID=CAMNT_0020575419 /DNA_START=143 /DNA_END=700 /DNA_ORIENTATION=-